MSTTALSFRFALYNMSNMRPQLSEYAMQLLVKTLIISIWWPAW